MSKENVEIVLGLYQPPDVDYVPLFRDDSLWAKQAEDLAPFVRFDFECVWYQFGSENRYAGLDGLRDFMLDWTAPWVTYRIEIEEAIDLGERVLMLNRDRGRRVGSTQEVEGRLAALWTICDGKMATSRHTHLAVSLAPGGRDEGSPRGARREHIRGKGGNCPVLRERAARRVGRMALRATRNDRRANRRVRRCCNSARSRAGVELQMDLFQVVRVREGMIVYAAGYLDRRQALEDAGLQE